jgi:hypothetical protein
LPRKLTVIPRQRITDYGHTYYALPGLALSVAQREQESRTAPMISKISREQQSTQVRPQYIDVGDESVSLIVFNFTEYLTSTLCIHLPFGYLQFYPFWVFCPSHIAVELVAWMEYCSGVVGGREVELVVVLASFYER